MPRFHLIKKLTQEQIQELRDKFGRKPRQYRYSQLKNYFDCPQCGCDPFFFKEITRYNRLLKTVCTSCGADIK